MSGETASFLTFFCLSTVVSYPIGALVVARLISALLTLVILTIPSYLLADATGDARVAIQKLYDASSTACAKKNIDGIFAACLSDYYTVDSRGRKTILNELKSESKNTVLMASSIVTSTKINSFSLKQGDALSNVTEINAIAVPSYQPRMFIKIKTTIVHEDTWKKTPKGWKLKMTRIISQKRDVSNPSTQ